MNVHIVVVVVVVLCCCCCCCCVAGDVVACPLLSCPLCPACNKVRRSDRIASLSLLHHFLRQETGILQLFLLYQVTFLHSKEEQLSVDTFVGPHWHRLADDRFPRGEERRGEEGRVTTHSGFGVPLMPPLL